MSEMIQAGTLEITNEEHHAMRGLSVSGMKDLAVSPMRYWYLHINPDRPTREETAAMRVGSALHCAVLEPDQFGNRYARKLDSTDWPRCLDTISDIREWITEQGAKPSGTRKDQVIEQALAMGCDVPILQVQERIFAEENEGKAILSTDEWDRVTAMAGALLDEESVAELLSDGQAEVSMVGIDEETGVALKGRLDWITPKYTLDLKTFTSQHGKTIDKSIADAIYYEGYYKQAWHYRHLRALATGGPSLPVLMAFVESEPPHEVRLKRFRMDTVYANMARAEINALKRLYADCVARYGDKPWREPQPIEELTDEDIKQIAWS